MERFANIPGRRNQLENETMEELLEILRNPVEISPTISCPQAKSVDGYCNEVYPNLFISGARAARNKNFLKTTGVTHVLNTAEGDEFCMVNTNSEFYGDIGIKYRGLQLEDFPNTPILRYFQDAAEFIDEGISSGGKVLVHCFMGISRSSTCAIAYLMIKKQMTVLDAVRQIRSHRQIRPNDGFLCQLVELNQQLQANLPT